MIVHTQLRKRVQEYLDAKYGKHLPLVKEIPLYQVGSLVYVRNHDATEKGPE